MNDPDNTRPKLTLFGGDYEHVLEMSQVVDGVNIEYHPAPPADIFMKMISSRAFEACEFSLSNFLILKDRGADWLTPVPVFPYRAFRHSTLFVRKDSPIVEPKGLIGRTIGVPDYSMTAAVWTRGILFAQYAVHWSQMQWVTSGPQRFESLGDLPIRGGTDDLEDALVAGRIDALLTTRLRDIQQPAFRRLLRPLMPDVEAVERDYFSLTGIYPINHLVAIRQDTLERIPDLRGTLYKAYVEAKNAAYRRRLGSTLVPWGENAWASAMTAFDGDPLPYGDTPKNREIVELVASFLFEQKLVARRPDCADIFAPLDAVATSHA